MRHLAIIGTAGRRDDAPRLGVSHYEAMQRAALKVAALTDCQGAVSGGAAWADHVAVELFLAGKLSSLLLNLPCPYDEKTGRYQDTGVKDFRANPGGTSNYYHTRFSEALYRKPNVTLGQLGLALHRGARGQVGHGFFDRNSAVASAADAIFACTFGQHEQLKDGGTLDTWEKFREAHPEAPAYHLDLSDCTLWVATPLTIRQGRSL